MCYDLSVLKTRSESSHVDALERRLEGIDDKSISSITNCVDILATPHESREGGRMQQPLQSASHLSGISGY